MTIWQTVLFSDSDHDAKLFEMKRARVIIHLSPTAYLLDTPLSLSHVVGGVAIFTQTLKVPF
jgi:hypothetical protein